MPVLAQAAPALVVPALMVPVQEVVPTAVPQLVLLQLAQRPEPALLLLSRLPARLRSECLGNPQS